MAANNSAVVFEATIGDKLAATIAESVVDRRAIDFDC